MKKNVFTQDWIIVFVWFVLSLLIFYAGHLYSNDTVSKIESATNLIRRGSFDVSGYHGAWGKVGRDNKTYPHFSLGSVLIMVPPVAVYETLSGIAGRPLPPFVRSALVSGMNLLYTALSGCCIFLLLLHFGKSRREAFLFANIAVFCSAMLPYSSTGWSEPAALFFGLAGFVLLLRKNQWIWWAVCAFAASLVRMEYVAFFMCYVLIRFLYDTSQWKRFIFPAVILSSVMVCHLWFNYYRFGSVFNFGYFGRESGTGPSVLSTGVHSAGYVIRRFFSREYFMTLFRTYISFGRVHWFWVSPLLAFSPVALFYKKIPISIKTVFTAGCFELVVIAAMGNNSWCWANRYLYTIFPFLLLPVFFLPLQYNGVSISFKIAAVAGFFISSLASLVNAHHVQELLVGRYGYQKAMWDYTSTFFTAPFWLHVRLFPRQAINTFGLMMRGSDLPSWEILRTECLDIWPVGLCGAGINSFVAFGLWGAATAMAAICFLKSIRPRFCNE